MSVDLERFLSSIKKSGVLENLAGGAYAIIDIPLYSSADESIAFP